MYINSNDFAVSISLIYENVICTYRMLFSLHGNECMIGKTEENDIPQINNNTKRNNLSCERALGEGKISVEIYSVLLKPYIKTQKISNEER